MNGRHPQKVSEEGSLKWIQRLVDDQPALLEPSGLFEDVAIWFCHFQSLDIRSGFKASLLAGLSSLRSSKLAPLKLYEVLQPVVASRGKTFS
jgi:hypothetical protein